MKTGNEGDRLCFEVAFLFKLQFVILIPSSSLDGQLACILYPLSSIPYPIPSTPLKLSVYLISVTTSFSISSIILPFLPS